jgi:hypothetical protein
MFRSLKQLAKRLLRKLFSLEELSTLTERVRVLEQKVADYERLVQHYQSMDSKLNLLLARKDDD